MGRKLARDYGCMGRGWSNSAGGVKLILLNPQGAQNVHVFFNANATPAQQAAVEKKIFEVFGKNRRMVKDPQNQSGPSISITVRNIGNQSRLQFLESMIEIGQVNPHTAYAAAIRMGIEIPEPDR